MPKSKHRVKPAPRTIAKDGSPFEKVAGVEGGNMIVRRHELSRYVELRLQAFLSEELHPTITAIAAEVAAEVIETALAEMLPALVQKAVAAHYGTETAMQAPPRAGLVGLDGMALSADRPALALVLAE